MVTRRSRADHGLITPQAPVEAYGVRMWNFLLAFGAAVLAGRWLAGAASALGIPAAGVALLTAAI